MHLSSDVDLSVDSVVTPEFKFSWLVQRYELKRKVTAKVKKDLLATGKDYATRHRQNVLTGKVELGVGDQFAVLDEKAIRQSGEIWMKVHILKCTDRSKVGTEAYLPHRAKNESKPIWDDPELLKSIQNGEIIDVKSRCGNAISVDAGTLLWQTGEGTAPDGSVKQFMHWSMFSEKNLFEGLNGWVPINDQSGDNLIEETSVLEMIPQSEARRGKPLSASEVDMFYSSKDAGVAQAVRRLRQYVVRFRSEWASDLDSLIPKLEKLVKSMNPNASLDSDAVRKQNTPFLWWTDPALAQLGLPATGEVWHYHPVSVLAAFSGYKDIVANQFSQQISLQDEDGMPIQGVSYQIRSASSGEILLKGITDSTGKTERVYAEKEDTFQVEIVKG